MVRDEATGNMVEGQCEVDWRVARTELVGPVGTEKTSTFRDGKQE